DNINERTLGFAERLGRARRPECRERRPDEQRNESGERDALMDAESGPPTEEERDPSQARQSQGTRALRPFEVTTIRERDRDQRDTRSRADNICMTHRRRGSGRHGSHFFSAHLRLSFWQVQGRTSTAQTWEVSRKLRGRVE